MFSDAKFACHWTLVQCIYKKYHKKLPQVWFNEHLYKCRLVSLALFYNLNGNKLNLYILDIYQYKLVCASLQM